METPDEFDAVHIDGKRVDLKRELRDLVSGRRRAWSGGCVLSDVTTERITMIRRQLGARARAVP